MEQYEYFTSEAQGKDSKFVSWLDVDPTSSRIYSSRQPIFSTRMPIDKQVAESLRRALSSLNINDEFRIGRDARSLEFSFVGKIESEGVTRTQVTHTIKLSGNPVFWAARPDAVQYENSSKKGRAMFIRNSQFNPLNGDGIEWEFMNEEEVARSIYSAEMATDIALKLAHYKSLFSAEWMTIRHDGQNYHLTNEKFLSLEGVKKKIEEALDEGRKAFLFNVTSCADGSIILRWAKSDKRVGFVSPGITVHE